nr:hypothetical protein Iba_chr12aCG12190 [Ipomoea batatas]GMD68670.1 hypothetical protein Iba_chr12dCG11440 [Ipomoea batatas]GMD70731.1 hypothetical protein Iba_chr12eCG9150 [Ipomoea batatas]GME05622.1 hypothetical protein Iba_scaffold3049CG1570 [Ipomoea batatas]
MWQGEDSPEMAFDNLLLRYSVAMASVRDGDVVCRVLYEEAENSEGYYRRLEKCHLKVLGLGVRVRKLLYLPRF